MREDGFTYEIWVANALKSVLHQALIETAANGMTGDHHFYISFDTNAPGVSISKRLREKYPNEMTIVLQHRFWDLLVSDERFEVKLTFDGIPERVVVPFSAIKVFFDPSVRYGLQFEEPDFNAEAVDLSVTSLDQNFTDSETGQFPAEPATVSHLSKHASDHGEERHTDDAGSAQAAPTATKSQERPGHNDDGSDEHAADGEPAGAEIVSLDAFRKK